MDGVPPGEPVAAVWALVILAAAGLEEVLVVRDADELVEADRARLLVVPSAVALAGRRARAPTPRLIEQALFVMLRPGPRIARPGEAVPHGSRVLNGIGREGEVAQLVAAHKVAILTKLDRASLARIGSAAVLPGRGPCAQLKRGAVPHTLKWSRALASVKGKPHAKVHALIEDGLSRPGLDLVADDPGDTKLPRRLVDDLVVQVPEHTSQAARVHVVGRVGLVTHSPVHVEGVERGRAGLVQLGVGEHRRRRSGDCRGRGSRGGARSCCARSGGDCRGGR
mmetsp:Transcript_18043/g.54370  ORF Transcript_18043/g.54370 Transcript_18043/m.54370 type:complete len:281 (+) Transcript_18043:547-1389(+)